MKNKVAASVLYLLYMCFIVCLLGSNAAVFEFDVIDEVVSYLDNEMTVDPPSSAFDDPLMVDLTLVQGADSKGAVCLDGTLPGYHLHPGSGSGLNSWLIHLEGGAWCDTIKNCVNRKTTRLGSSKFMEKKMRFIGILSDKQEENPDFFNWNRVKARYCDGASFTGEGQNESAGLYFRGQRIWSAAMEELLGKGMKNASQALLSGCSAGGLASMLHCDEFRNIFPESTKVKCLSDAGMFLNAVDVSGGHALRDVFEGTVTLQGVAKNLPSACTDHLDPTSCFFPENVLSHIKTPMFLLNAAYDEWQVRNSLCPPSADPSGFWSECKKDIRKCNSSQIQLLQDFRNEMLNAIKVFSTSNQNGLFINSCFAHCHSERQDTWFADDSPLVDNKKIAQSVGDWYFDRTKVKAIDCPYPCDMTCHNNVYQMSEKLTIIH